MVLQVVGLAVADLLCATHCVFSWTYRCYCDLGIMSIWSLYDIDNFSKSYYSLMFRQSDWYLVHNLQVEAFAFR
jgi:hypothetical protein